MRKEIAAVVFFLKTLIKKREKLDSHKIELFVERLAVALQEKFRGHWYPDNPSRGQAFRCIRVNRFQRQDPELLRACQESGVHYNDLGLPRELTLWVDPGEVCCRYGEQNPCFSVASFSSDDEDKDVTKKVTSALERVTSDYHSGSSSDEESTFASPLTIPYSRRTHQAMNPAAPTWHPKKKMVPGKGHILPRPQYGFRPRGRVPHTLRHNVWIPPGYGGGPAYWDNNQNMAHCYS
ncbi:protein BTG3 [Myripristis murdjan]|uniref:B-cell translocation gene 3 n=1 Tax=Myripristis murdjan TaxID=586833 RepID=A0A667YHB6_9TELE|nr:protein BTG3 [Myripristis murdjan]